jgi:hypothetical protein
MRRYGPRPVSHGHKRRRSTEFTVHHSD